MSQVQPQSRRFPIRIGQRSRILLRLVFGVTDHNSYVDVSATSVAAHFGYFHLLVPIDNIGQWTIEGPWLWITAIGVRRGVIKGDITFAGNHVAGVHLEFKRPERRSVLRIPRLYVTVADVEGFGAALTAAGIPGDDARQ